MIGLLVLLLAAPASAPAAATPSAEEIVRRMDAVMTFQTRVSDATMTVVKDGSTEVRGLKIWARGATDSYVEFTAPARDKGTKYLKLDQNLYMYLPRTEKVVKISGHLLRQSLMDSDFSYEDMLETRAVLDAYDAKVLGEEKLDGQDCWVLDLTAKAPGQTYARRKTWVAKASAVPLRAERFAQSGLLLKVLTMSDLATVGGRTYPTRMIMQDQLRQGSRTELHLENMVFDQPLPESRFSRRELMKGD